MLKLRVVINDKDVAEGLLPIHVCLECTGALQRREVLRADTEPSVN